MLHPSYADLINVVNSGVEPGEQPVVQSRYSIVLASAKRARQLIEETDPMSGDAGKKPLSEAIQEIYDGRVKIIGDSDESEAQGFTDAAEQKESNPEAAGVEDSDPEGEDLTGAVTGENKEEE
ncbi:DNA-directed RNA polymerase subunit omega [Clostridiaceae bacterium]|nr:DNA-directed RNA polymerase subunit omega [Clostridiaceae bacterium]RKI09139.1 DNA-directed RNA polymerase subunit omega [bacterium 1XD21-70]